jgi:hypothetical protein
MPQNIWSAGRDALLDDLARRDAERFKQEQIARQERMDAESRSDRERQFRLQEEQLGLQKRDREMRADAALAAQGAAQEKNQKVQHLIRLVTDTTADPAARDQAGLELDLMGVDPSAINRARNGPPKPEVQPVYRTNPDGTVTKVGEVPKGTHFTQTDRPVGGASTDLAPDVKAYVDSLRALPNKQAAIDQVSLNIAEMRRKGEPLPDLAKIMARINQIFPAQRDELLGTTTFPGTPGLPGTGVPGVDAAVAASAPVAQPQAAPSDGGDAAAIAALQAAGREVTPETIAIAKQRMAGGR